MALPSDRAPHCAWTCHAAPGSCRDWPGEVCGGAFALHQAGSGCAVLPIHLMANHIHRRKGDDYSTRQVLPPLGEFKEKKHA